MKTLHFANVYVKAWGSAGGKLESEFAPVWFLIAGD